MRQNNFGDFPSSVHSAHIPDHWFAQGDLHTYNNWQLERGVSNKALNASLASSEWPCPFCAFKKKRRNTERNNTVVSFNVSAKYGHTSSVVQTTVAHIAVSQKLGLSSTSVLLSITIHVPSQPRLYLADAIKLFLTSLLHVYISHDIVILDLLYLLVFLLSLFKFLSSLLLPLPIDTGFALFILPIAFFKLIRVLFFCS